MHRGGVPYTKAHRRLDPGGTPVGLLTGECCPELLWEQVWAQPEGTAVISGDEVLTFRELAERGSDLAVHLRHLGVAADDRVGVFADPTTELMVAVWGILFAGGAYVPLSPEYPRERLRYMIEDSGVSIIVAQEGLAARLAELAPRGTRIVTPAQAAEFAAAHGRAGEWELRGGLRPGDLAYVIYTSGSTGRPKGVMIEHRAIVNQMRWLNTAQGLGRRSVVLQKTPISFDAAQWELLAPGCGATVVMGTAGLYRDPERLIDAIVTHGVTTLQCVPTLLQALLDTEAFHTCASLTRIFSGGEALSKALALRCLETLPGCELINLYGPTECTINSSACAVDVAMAVAGPQTVSIGMPARDVRYHILDDRLSPVAVGEVGELYIGGVQLARGYLNRPDLTAMSFVDNPFPADYGCPKLYRTGDLVYRTPDGAVQFVGRADNQVKVRGFRIELDEIRHAIEVHDWVRNAAVVVRSDPRTGSRLLVAFIELNPREAALMDQGHPAAHHQSKESKLQVRAQLSNGGCREDTELQGRPVVDLPGGTPTPKQWRRVFARKSYRFFEGGAVTRADVLRLLARRPGAEARPGSPAAPGLSELGEILRYFGQFAGPERLLPKYGYASPGALYATQLYLEVNGIAGLEPGRYYYHPVRHRLVLIDKGADAAAPAVRVHFVGKRRAIEPVYRSNVREVLEIETGHMVGLFEEILPDFGLGIRPVAYEPAVMAGLECADDDEYLGTFELVPYRGPADVPVDLYVQSHPGRIPDLPAGLYRYADGDLLRISDEIILRRHVIAINQQVYRRASLGISMVGRRADAWLRYIDLGRTLHRLQASDLGLGFMSSGYSSETGDDLPTARALTDILRSCGRPTGPSYFCIGGRVSDEQVRSRGMKEDAVHMKGPTEMIRDDLADLLPDYMIPNRVVILDRLPLTPSGKIDGSALEALDITGSPHDGRPFVAPRTPTEERIAAIWRRLMKTETASVHDDFFECGGDSLVAVAFVNALNREFSCELPLQVMFEAPTVERLASRIDGTAGARPVSRLVRLSPGEAGAPVYCWPGLGGYTMNLRPLAGRVGADRPFYGVQAHGINPGETPYATIEEMAAADVRLIRELQPAGPYTLWGYSFGARVAFEAACQIEGAGERVDELFLIAPGSPRVGRDRPAAPEHPYVDPAYLTILFSVFAGAVSGPLLEECLRTVRDEEGFTSFITGRFEDLDPDLVRRIVRIVGRTYGFAYTRRDPVEHRLAAPLTIYRARGDELSFFESGGIRPITAPTVVDLGADHYGVLREPDVGGLVRAIEDRRRAAA